MKNDIFSKNSEFKENFVVFCLLSNYQPHMVGSIELERWDNWQAAEYEAYRRGKALSQEAPGSINSEAFSEFVKAKYRELWEGK